MATIIDNVKKISDGAKEKTMKINKKKVALIGGSVLVAAGVAVAAYMKFKGGAISKVAQTVVDSVADAAPEVVDAAVDAAI